jgi:soluble lytic murein transglycosylase
MVWAKHDRSQVIARVSAAVLVVLAGSTCDAPANRPAASAQPAVPSPPTDFDAHDAVARSEAVQRILDAPTLDERRARARAALEANPADDERGRLWWLGAQAALEAQDWTDASRQLSLLGESDHALAPWARLLLAEGLVRVDARRSVDLSRPLADERWGGRVRAQRLLARALVDVDRAEAVVRLREIVNARAAKHTVVDTVLVLADLLAEGEDPAEHAEALALYREIATNAPLSRAGQEAEPRIVAMLASLPAAERRRQAFPTAEEKLVRAQAFLRGLAYDRAEDEARGLATATRDPALRCAAELTQGKAMLGRRERDASATLLERVADRCTESETRAAALYHAAQAHARRGRHGEAVRLYDRLEALEPASTLADDARYRAALSSLALGDAGAFRERLEALPGRYPTGDMRGEARFRLAWDALARARDATGDEQTEALRAALAELDASLAADPLENAEDIRGRSRYWRARVLAQLGETAGANDALEAIARELPLSYYGQQSLARLEEADAVRAGVVRTSLAPAPSRAAFALRPELEEPAFVRAIELARLRAFEEARSDFEALGVFDDDELAWIALATLSHAGDHAYASRVARRRHADFMLGAPAGDRWVRWRIAYPDAYDPLIETAASAESVPPSFVRAVAREESAFDPTAVSPALAYGLIQLIQPTARRFGRELGLATTPADLKTPEINLRIGSRFISFLWRRYESNPAIVPAAYNAGEAAADGWLRARPTEPLDVWIENIPYDETRRYTRRVLQTYGVYSWLESSALPPLSAVLPPADAAAN